MGDPAFDWYGQAAGEDAAGEVAQQVVQQAPKLTVIEGGLGGAATEAGAAEGGVAVAEGIGGAGLLEGAGVAGLSATGVGLIVVGVVALGGLGYLAYKHYHQPKAQADSKPADKPEAVTCCPDGIVKLKCKDGWDDCQKRQAREKVRRLNEMLKNAPQGFKSQSTAGALRADGDRWAAKFRDDFDRLANGDPAKNEFTSEGVKGPSTGPESFMDPCLYEQWVKGGKKDSSQAPLNGASPDHIRELQLGGDPQGQMVWLDRSVNRSLGSQIQQALGEDGKKVDPIKGFKLECE